jgi:phosphoribosylanthranilate isomerase
MEPTLRPRVKICCIASADEAWRAIGEGAAAVGLVSAMPSGPGPIPEEEIAAIAAAVPPGIARFLLTSQTEAAPILAQQRRCATDVLQLVDAVPESELQALRAELPGISLVQVVHVTGEEALDQARAVEALVDAVLLDSGNPAAAVKELGGTGRTHDWELSRRIREALRIPVWLAGGLSAANVGRSIEAVRPFGVDLCSGVRTGGRLDPVKLAAFFRAVRAVA